MTDIPFSADPTRPVLPAMPARPTLRVTSPVELVEAVAYLLGAQPTDSLVLAGQMADHGERARRLGPVLRFDLPPPDAFPAVAEHGVRLLAEAGATGLSTLVHVDSAPPGEPGSSDRPVVAPGRGAQPRLTTATTRSADGHGGVSARRVVGYYRPLHRRVAHAAAQHRLTVLDGLCVTRSRCWSYTCSRATCCPPGGVPVPPPGSSALAAAAATAGLAVPRPLTELGAHLRPPGPAGQRLLERHYNQVAAELVRRCEDPRRAGGVRPETIALLNAARERFRSGNRHLRPAEAARLVLGLADAEVRDRVMSWEDHDPEPLLALWSFLARNAVPPASAPPLTLAAWVAWTSNQGAVARVAINLALDADPDYRMAVLLCSGINSAVDPRRVRESIFGATALGRARA